MAGSEKSLHDGHRQRLREKFINRGADAIEEHELVELLLFYAIPRKNTNEIAHKLVNEFGNLAGIMDADIENIAAVKDMGYNSAIFFKLLQACANKYINQVNNISGSMVNPHNIHAYIKNLFYGHSQEIAYAIFLDNQSVARMVKKLSDGTANETTLNIDTVLKLALNQKYPYMILAHNHPNGNAMPSPEDIYFTKRLEMALSFTHVRMVDHLIVSGDNVISMSNHLNMLDK